jgi:hypothetical protein
MPSNWINGPLQFEGKFCKAGLNGLAPFPVQFIADRGCVKQNP